MPIDTPDLRAKYDIIKHQGKSRKRKIGGLTLKEVAGKMGCSEVTLRGYTTGSSGTPANRMPDERYVQFSKIVQEESPEKIDFDTACKLVASSGSIFLQAFIISPASWSDVIHNYSISGKTTVEIKRTGAHMMAAELLEEIQQDFPKIRLNDGYRLNFKNALPGFSFLLQFSGNQCNSIPFGLDDNGSKKYIQRCDRQQGVLYPQQSYFVERKDLGIHQYVSIISTLDFPPWLKTAMSSSVGLDITTLNKLSEFISALKDHQREILTYECLFIK